MPLVPAYSPAPRARRFADSSAACQRHPAPAVDFARAFWTPPLAPACALSLERKQIADRGLAPIVSLTDHDSIEAGLALQEGNRDGDTPISVEWTVPYEQSILHLGIHNLPPSSAQSWMSVMASYTGGARRGSLALDLAESEPYARSPSHSEPPVCGPRRAVAQTARRRVTGTRRWARSCLGGFSRLRVKRNAALEPETPP